MSVADLPILLQPFAQQLSINGGARRELNPPALTPICQKRLFRLNVPSPLVLETCQPDRPRSAVPAARQIIKIVLNISSTSKFNVALKINETEDMNPTESAHILSKKPPIHGPLAFLLILNAKVMKYPKRLMPV